MRRPTELQIQKKTNDNEGNRTKKRNEQERKKKNEILCHRKAKRSRTKKNYKFNAHKLQYLNQANRLNRIFQFVCNTQTKRTHKELDINYCCAAHCRIDLFLRMPLSFGC